MRCYSLLPLALTGCIPGGLPAAASAPTVSAPAALLPAWEARPVRPAAQITHPSELVVKPGDTLSELAQESGRSVAQLARANRLSAPYPLSAGQRLTVPGGRTHRVQTGETGIAIARAYGVRWSELVALNDLAEPYRLLTGTLLRLPDTAAATPRAEQRTASPTIGDILTGGEPAAVTLSLPDRLPRRQLTGVAPTTPVVAPARFAGRFAAPLTAPLAQRFGAMGSGQVNEGLNFAAPAGSAVGSAADGVVVFAAPGPGGYGGLVLIKHGDGYASAYGHLSAIEVVRGQRVNQGQRLGRSGQPARSDRPLLHFEIRRGADPVDPAPLIGL